jgi:hypothetical protein
MGLEQSKIPQGWSLIGVYLVGRFLREEDFTYAMGVYF